MADEERRVHFVKDSLVMHKNSRSQEWLNWGIRVVMAKNYIDNLREETTKGTLEKLAQGWLPGTPPPGYINVVRDGKKVQDFDPDKYKSMQYIFQLFLEPGQSIDTIRRKMFELGLTTTSGRMLVKNQAHRVLKNPYYIGIIVWDGNDPDLKFYPHPDPEPVRKGEKSVGGVMAQYYEMRLCPSELPQATMRYWLFSDKRALLTVYETKGRKFEGLDNALAAATWS
jgi:hypothetical protein